MRFIGLVSIALIMGFTIDKFPDFKSKQLEYDRVVGAYTEKLSEVRSRLQAAQVPTDSFDIFIRAFKFEEDLEVWAKGRNDSVFSLVKTYKFCENVGELGPKRKEGDKQIPEGAYELIKFNPESNYHLSLKINYPNKSDSVLSDPVQPGGMIFIHGGCQTVGCIPITDNFIKELYVFAVEARTGGQENIPVHIYPFRMGAENLELMNLQYANTERIAFWEQLEKGYRLFEESRQLPAVQFFDNGSFTFR